MRSSYMGDEGQEQEGAPSGQASLWIFLHPCTWRSFSNALMLPGSQQLLPMLSANAGRLHSWAAAWPMHCQAPVALVESNDAMQVSFEPGAPLQDMRRDEHGAANGLSKWSSMRSRMLQLSTPSGSANNEAAALHLTTPISRYETSYPHGTGMHLPLFRLPAV